MARCGASTAPVSRRKDRKKRSSVQLSALLRGGWGCLYTAPFACLKIQLIRLLFFSRNGVFLSQQFSRNSVLACFFSQIQPNERGQGGKKLIQSCKPALESDHITKVIHDCKRDSEVPSYAFENI